jgi:putative transposase
VTSRPLPKEEADAPESTDEQIVGILHEGEAGRKVDELCRVHGINKQTYYRWKAKFGGLKVDDAKRLRQLEDENRRLKQALAEGTLDKQVWKDLLSRKW